MVKALEYITLRDPVSCCGVVVKHVFLNTQVVGSSCSLFQIHILNRILSREKDKYIFKIKGRDLANFDAARRLKGIGRDVVANRPQ